MSRNLGAFVRLTLFQGGLKRGWEWGMGGVIKGMPHCHHTDQLRSSLFTLRRSGGQDVEPDHGCFLQRTQRSLSFLELCIWWPCRHVQPPLRGLGRAGYPFPGTCSQFTLHLLALMGTITHLPCMVTCRGGHPRALLWFGGFPEVHLITFCFLLPAITLTSPRLALFHLLLFS